MSTWTSGDIAALSVSGLTDDEASILRKLLRVWHDRLGKNAKRSLYFGGDQAFKDLGIALPPQLKSAKTCLGWPLQAVRKPASRSQFQGLLLPGVDDPFDLREAFARNRFDVEFSQSTVDANKLGVSFTTVTKGAPGEPDVMIQSHSAEWSAATWDSRARQIATAMTVNSADSDGNPSKVTLYLPDQVVVCSKGLGWSVDYRTQNVIGRVPVVPVTHDPQLNRPFGRSRISGPVMALTDMAVRAYVRMEGNAELYSFPQLAAEGVDPEAFAGMGDAQKFKLAMDRIIALSKDEDGDKPTLKQFAQGSMQPHSDMLRTLAMAFCGETGIPPASLGVVADSNPSSEAAIRAGEHDLLIDVTNQNRYVLNHAVSDIARLAVMVRDGLHEPPRESWNLSARFADPEFRSTSANADAFVKLAGANADLVDSDVLLGMLFDPAEVKQVQAHLAKKRGPSILDRVMARGSEDQTTDATTQDR